MLLTSEQNEHGLVYTSSSFALLSNVLIAKLYSEKKVCN